LLARPSALGEHVALPTDCQVTAPLHRPELSVIAVAQTEPAARQRDGTDGGDGAIGQRRRTRSGTWAPCNGGHNRSTGRPGGDGDAALHTTATIRTYGDGFARAECTHYAAPSVRRRRTHEASLQAAGAQVAWVVESHVRVVGLHMPLVSTKLLLCEIPKFVPAST